MLFARSFFFFGAQNFQGLNEPAAGFARPDRGVGELFGQSFEGAVEALEILGHFLGPGLGGIGRVLDLTAKKHVDRAAAAHHRQLDAGPDKKLIGAHLAGAERLLGAAIALAQHHGDLWHRRLGVGIEHFRAVPDDPFFFLLLAGKKTRHIHQGDDWDIKCVAKADEAGRLVRGVNVEAAGEKHRLIGDEARRITVEAAETDH